MCAFRIKNKRNFIIKCFCFFRLNNIIAVKLAIPNIKENKCCLEGERDDKFINLVCLILAFVFLGIGCVGIFLPLLPSTPFLVVAPALFAKSSQRFHRRFLSTTIYKNHLENLVLHRSMNMADKIKVLLIITILFTIGMIMSAGVIAKSVIWAVAVMHYLFFMFRIKTLKREIPIEVQEEL